MKLKLQAVDLRQALEIVSLVTPKPVTSQGGEGYLFEVRGDKCTISSRDMSRFARSEVSVTAVEGEGFFVYPADRAGSVKYMDGWIEIETGNEEDSHWIKYTTEGGASAERASFNPALLQAGNDDGEEIVEHEYPAAVLKEALTLARPFMIKPNDTQVGEDREHLKSVRIFDSSQKEWAKGDGCLFAAEDPTAFFFHCDAFKGKGLSVHGAHLPCLIAFLSKCEGDVIVRSGETVSSVTNSKGDVLGWSKCVKQHTSYVYYPFKVDRYVLRSNKEILLKALRQIREEYDVKKDKARLIYSHKDRALRFQESSKSGKSSSFPVPVQIVSDEKSLADSSDFSANVSVLHFLGLVEALKGHEVELRVALVEREGKTTLLFRVVEEFWMTPQGKLVIPSEGEESYGCKVTRFMPSKD